MNWSRLKVCLVEKLRNEKGFSLIEILVVLSITSIVILSVGNFLVENIRLFESENDLLTIQDEASKAAKCFEEAAFEAEKIKSCTLKNGFVTEIIFINGTNETKIEQSGSALVRTKNSQDQTVATSIESIKATPLLDTNEVTIGTGASTNNGFTEDTTNGIALEINLKNDDQTHTVKQTIYFRNKN